MEIKVPVYVALDPALTKAAPEPKPPQPRCRDKQDRRTVCHRDEANYIDALRAWGRGLKKQVDEILGLQPK